MLREGGLGGLGGLGGGGGGLDERFEVLARSAMEVLCRAVGGEELSKGQVSAAERVLAVWERYRKSERRVGGDEVVGAFGRYGGWSSGAIESALGEAVQELAGEAGAGGAGSIIVGDVGEG